MSGRLSQRVAQARQGQRKLFMAALVMGDPNMEACARCISALVGAGVDALELIWPFSLPSAHGSVIQRACHRALKGGVDLDAVCELLGAVRQAHDVPLIVSSYANRLHAKGLEQTLSQLVESGCDGLMLTDVAWSADSALHAAASEAGLCVVPSISATTPTSRAAQIIESADSLVVYTGHIGEPLEDKSLAMERLQTLPEVPGALVASMQISSGLEARAVSQFCDGVLIGSALVWLVEGRGQELEQRLSAFAREVRAGLDTHLGD